MLKYKKYYIMSQQIKSLFSQQFPIFSKFKISTYIDKLQCTISCKCRLCTWTVNNVHVHYDWHWSRKPTCYQIKVHCNSHNAYQQSYEVAYDKHNIKHDHICTCKHIHLWLGVSDPYIDTNCHTVVLSFHWNIHILHVFIVLDSCLIILVCQCVLQCCSIFV